ncbi:MAG: SUMF1/EgtB/PvdO family nonheme iron enzyme, partial [Kiritimatiellia bacterium]
METMPVGDAGNHADPLTGFGAVSDAFRIGTFEVKNGEYAVFLNAVDPDGINTAKLYNISMSTEACGGISFSAGNSDGAKYDAKANMADKPVIFVTYYAMLRFANWMHHGASNYASSALGAAVVDDGAYTLNGAAAGPLVAKNPGAKWWLPTEDEWYKAAYYKGGSASAGYWSYATQSDTKPGYSFANASGAGSAGSAGNFANTDRSAGWNGEDGNVTTV